MPNEGFAPNGAGINRGDARHGERYIPYLWEPEPAPPKVRWWLHGLLLAVTLLTTSVMGAAFARGFAFGQPPDIIEGLNGYVRMFSDPWLLVTGLPFSITLIIVLLAHELGHYLTCLYYRIGASAPYFLPFPAPIGTLGAFIRIRAPIYSKRALFDISVAGPLAGFFFVLPALAMGLAWSKVIPGIAEQGEMVFGVPLVLRLLEAAVFPGVPAADIHLHPVARAAWVGVLATALNLLPIGQLDGGHILYAFVGEKTRVLSRLLVAALIPLGLLTGSYSWLIWSAFLFFFGMRHPVIYDAQPLSPGRRLLGALAAIILVLCFTLRPVS